MRVKSILETAGCWLGTNTLAWQTRSGVGGMAVSFVVVGCSLLLFQPSVFLTSDRNRLATFLVYIRPNCYSDDFTSKYVRTIQIVQRLLCAVALPLATLLVVALVVQILSSLLPCIVWGPG